MFALDAFDGTHTVWEQLGHFLMHLIPSFILLIVFFVATKWELIGGILFILIGVALSPPVFILNYRMNESIGMSLSVIDLPPEFRTTANVTDCLFGTVRREHEEESI